MLPCYSLRHFADLRLMPLMPFHADAITLDYVFDIAAATLPLSCRHTPCYCHYFRMLPPLTLIIDRYYC